MTGPASWPRISNNPTHINNFFGMSDLFGTIENIFIDLDQDLNQFVLSDVIFGSLADPIALIGLVVVGLFLKPWWKAALIGALWMAIFRVSILLFAYCVISHPYTLASLRSTLRLRGRK